MIRLHIPETRDVDAVRSTSDRSLIGEPRDHSRRARSVVMVHHVLAECATRIRQAVREARALRVEQQPNRLNGRCTEEDDACRVLARLHGVRVGDTNTARAVSLRIVEYFSDNTVWPQRELAGFL